jgi:UPF0755 protein
MSDIRSQNGFGPNSIGASALGDDQWSTDNVDGWGNDSAWAKEGDWGQASNLFSRNDEGFDRDWSNDQGYVPRQVASRAGEVSPNFANPIQPGSFPGVPMSNSVPLSNVQQESVEPTAFEQARINFLTGVQSSGAQLNKRADESGRGSYDPSLNQASQPQNSSTQSSSTQNSSPQGNTRPGNDGSPTATREKSRDAGRSGRGRRGRRYADDVEDDFDDYDDFPPPRRGRAFLGFLAVMIVLAGGVLFGLRWYRSQVTPSGSQGPKVTVTIPTNTSTAEIGKILHKNKIIGNATLFRYYAQYKGKGGFEAGRYEFPTNSSFDQVLSTLTKGAAVPDQNKVTVPEGYRIEQTADRIVEKLPGRSRDLFIQAATSGKIKSAYSPTGSLSLEGFLFPDTYTFNLSDDESTVVSRMVESFDQVAEGVELAKSQELVGLSSYDTLIVASLIEREAKIDSDRAKISRVIYNRLKTKTALQIDATLVYALGGVTRVLNEDLKKDGPYNTYTRKGLPPTPIASPGKASLQAALHPEVGDWLYYVVTGTDGSHGFATTYKEHKANIKLAKQRGLR